MSVPIKSCSFLRYALKEPILRLCYIRWNWLGGFSTSSDAQLRQPFAVAMISAREVEEHYLNLEQRIYPSWHHLQQKSDRESPPPPYDPPPAYHVALLREQQPAFVLSPSVLV